MIISDLNYLEVVAEASSVVGGDNKKRRNKKSSKPSSSSGSGNLQANVAVVTQVATANSVAISEDGDAYSKAIAENKSKVNQANVD